jgi:starch-binding outer membrane protein, SusD/RagB family
MKYKKIFVDFFVIAAIIYSCNKSALNQPPLGNIQQTDMENKAGVQSLLIGTYAVLDGYGTIAGLIDYGRATSKWLFGSICGSEAYKGSGIGDQENTMNPIEAFQTTPYNEFMEQKWSSLYDGISRANEVLRIMRKAKDMSADDTVEVRAESLFLRAFYHFEAKKMWNRIQMVNENISYEAGNYQVVNDTSWSLIESDLQYAADHLPAKQSAPGRVNKYAAEAYLAKAYLFEHKFADAGPLLTDIITNGVNSSGTPYSLNKKYRDNFDPSLKNGPESVFAAQMDVNDGSGGSNGSIGDQITYTLIGYGFFLPSQYLVNHFKTDASTGLPDLDNFNTTDVKNDWKIPSSDPFTPDTISLDPRLDWTVGRRGIPYLDWGIEPGADWVRDQPYENYGPYTPKKSMINNSQQANYAESGGWAGSKITANNLNLVRFADVILWAAEAAVENGNPDAARLYVNQVRQRAADSASWVYQYNINPGTGLPDSSLGNSNIPAANYKVGLYTQPWTDPVSARKAVRYERMLELGMEGHRFFDLVRWGIAETEINSYLQKEMITRPALLGASFEKRNEYFPIPQAEISLSVGSDGVPKMIQNPGY